ncbi:MAG: glycosyltransferase [Bryobacterales bacterium]|nr:glycosyltransferase [Bryobacterales bacterium]
MALLGRLARALPLLIASPFLVITACLGLALSDLLWRARRRRLRRPETRPSTRAATVVIPTWNARDLLEKHLPSVVDALAGNPRNEILLVDNGSEDGTAAWVRERFPSVKVLALPANLGFGGGSNAGFRAAANDVVVLLNNDMRVEPGFLQPLLDGFTDELVFSVSCQIFFSDPARRREETGLSRGWWRDGMLRVGHRVDEGVRDLFPCFYGGGGSTAYDRRKFLELGGFDPLLSPFYLEDTDLGYMAWKRGWKVMYHPESVVYHEHRGTIGKRFTDEQIRAVLATNFILWCWKNIHEWPRLLSHFFFAHTGALASVVLGDSPERGSLTGLWRAFLRLPQAMRSRLRARDLAAVSDTEAFRRPLGGYFRDRFEDLPPRPEKLRVLFVSPYPILPPVHGGGVFMHQTLSELSRLCELHLIVLLHYAHELPANEPLRAMCSSVEFLVKTNARSQTAASILPHAVREFASEDLLWLIHRQLHTRRIDVLQLEYTPLAQYAGRFGRLVSALFEHDVYFQSVARGWSGLLGLTGKLAGAVEYLRALRYETRALEHLDLVQTCSRENLEYLLSFAPALNGKLQTGLRAAIDTRRYQYQPGNREPLTMLFVGSFRHLPNQAALQWFTNEVLPVVSKHRPEARLVVVGSDPPPPHAFPSLDHVELRGAVEDIREPLSRYAVFVCPVLSGSGVRVKLLEAFASGIPVVSTRLGAEGLTASGSEVCLLADEAQDFAAKILSLFGDPERARSLAARARAEVEANWDVTGATARLLETYHAAVVRKRAESTGCCAAP